MSSLAGVGNLKGRVHVILVCFSSISWPGAFLAQSRPSVHSCWNEPNWDYSGRRWQSCSKYLRAPDCRNASWKQTRNSEFPHLKFLDLLLTVLADFIQRPSELWDQGHISYSPSINVDQITPITTNGHLVKHAQNIICFSQFGVKLWSRQICLDAKILALCTPMPKWDMEREFWRRIERVALFFARQRGNTAG